MFKSYKNLFFVFFITASLVFGSVTPVKALTYPAEINKSFTPISILAGGTSVLRVTVYNPNGNPLTNTEWTDNLPANVVVANPPSVTTTCAGGVVTDAGMGSVNAGDTSIRLSSATVPAQVSGVPGSCYVEVSVTSTVPGNHINTIPANELTSTTLDAGVSVAITNTTPASATLNVITVQPPSLSKGFSPNTMFVGEVSTLTITLHNNDDNASLTNTTVRDALPAGVVVANPLNASLTGCGAGTLSSTLGGAPLVAGDTAIALNGATIASNANCVITVDVTSVLQGAYTNTIPAGPVDPDSIHTQQGVTNATPASANLNVQAFNLSKAFSPTTIAVGETSQLTITIQNPANFSYTGASITDNFPTGFVVASPLNASLNGCGSGTLTDGGGAPLNVGDTSVRLTGGDIAPLTTCTITINVTANMDVTAGTYTNTIPAGALTTDQGNSNHIPATDDIDVVGLTVAKAFSPTTFAAGSTSTLTITVSNPSPNPFTGASLSDTLPTSPNSNLRFTGTPTTTCAPGTVGLSGLPTRTVTLTNGTIPGGSILIPGTCTITVLVTTDANAPVAGPYTNTIPANNIVTNEGGTNPSPANGNVSVTTISVGKTFAPTTIAAGGTSTATITITNPATAGPLTGINLTDTLPAGIIVSGVPAPSQCNGGTVTNTVNSVTLTGGSLPAGLSSCTITFTVTAPSGTSSGTYTNTLGPGSVTTNEGPTNSNTSNTNLTVNAATVSKAFSPLSFQSGGLTTLTITLQNPTTFPYTGVILLDTLPAQLSIASSPAPINNCGGTLTAPSGTQSISLSGGAIPAGSSCTLIIPVTSTTPGGPYTNSIPPGGLTTAEGAQNTNTATANVSVYTVGAGVSLTKTFLPTSINRGGNSRLRLTISAPADTDLTNFNITDNLPGDLTVSNSTPPTITGCGVTYPSVNFNPLIGDTAVTLTGATVTRGTNCVITVYVTSNTGTSAGVVNTNTINPGDITNTENRSIPNPVSATLTVRTVSTLSTSKAFYPSIVSPDGLSTLTITLTNTNASSLVNVSLTDNLPGTLLNGVIVAPVPNASTTCGAGVITATPGSQVITLTNGTVPAQVGAIPGICTINVDVQGKGAAATRTNTIPTTNVVGTINGTTSTMNSQTAASAQIQIANLAIEVVKGFDPQLVYGGAVSTLSIRLRNPNSSAVLTGINFTDNMPANMIIANPPNFNPSAIGNCGAGAVLTGTPGTSTFNFSDGTLAAGAECTMTLSVTMTVNGNLTNTIPAGGVTTFNGVQNGTPTSASLTNLAGASLSKGFSPGVIAAGLSNYSVLTITITSTANVTLTGLGVVDNLPAGLEVAGGAAPAPTNTCGGTFAPNPGDTTVQLSGGTLPIGYVTCDLTVAVTGLNPGLYTNTIPAGSITNNEGVSNQSPTTAILELTPFSLGNRVWFDTNNNGLIDGSEVGVPGVRTELYRDNGTIPGVFDAGDTFVGFETTDVNGYYRFDNLGADDYIVTIPADNFRNVGGGDTVSGDPLAGYLSSGTSISSNGTPTDSIGLDPDDDIDDDDNGASTFTGTSTSYVASQAVTIGPSTNEPIGESPNPNPDTGEAPDNQSNRTVDFGFYRLTLGDLIFVDANNNGTFDSGDAPLESARVQLYTADGLTEIPVGPDGVLGTSDDAPGGVLTGVSGTYLFSGLPAGSYVVGVTPPTGYSSTIDTADSTDTNTTPNTNTNNNDNGVSMNSGQVFSLPVTLTPGSAGNATNNTVTNSDATTHDPTLDFGFMGNPGFTKSIITTNEAHTTGNNVAIGEIVTYEVVIEIPQGTPFNNVTITDQMDRGLAFVDCISVFVLGVDQTRTVCPPTVTPAVGTSVNPADDGGNVVFTIGNVTSTAPNQTITIQYRAIVLDVIENQENDLLNNSVTWAWDSGSQTTSAPNVQIVEPDLTIDKSALPTTDVAIGTPVQFTLVIDHTTPESQTDAFDVVVSDILPANLEYVQCSVTYTAGLAPDTPASTYCNPGNTTTDLIFEWAIFPLGSTSTITFNARLIGSPAINSAAVAWTSIPIDPQLPSGLPVILSTFNNESTERWYDPLDDVNIYSVSDSVTINSNEEEEERANLPSAIPATGFAPNRVTILAEQPKEKDYMATSVVLEIPRLGVKIPIVGVPLVDGDWDVSWLVQQAGWLQGTAFPSWQGNSVLTSHVTLADGTEGPFAQLGKLKWGDRIIVHAYGTKFIYEVRQNRTISPSNMTVFEHEEEAWLTLITCKNYNETAESYLNRIAIRAVLIDSVLENSYFNSEKR